MTSSTPPANSTLLIPPPVTAIAPVAPQPNSSLCIPPSVTSIAPVVLPPNSQLFKPPSNASTASVTPPPNSLLLKPPSNTSVASVTPPPNSPLLMPPPNTSVAPVASPPITHTVAQQPYTIQSSKKSRTPHTLRTPHTIQSPNTSRTPLTSQTPHASTSSSSVYAKRILENDLKLSDISSNDDDEVKNVRELVVKENKFGKENKIKVIDPPLSNPFVRKRKQPAKVQAKQNDISVNIYGLIKKKQKFSVVPLHLASQKRDHHMTIET